MNDFSKPRMSEIEFSWVGDVGACGGSIYMSDSYQTIFARYDGSEPRLLKCVARGKKAYLPMLVRDLGNDRREAYSAYGYGGLFGEHILSEADVEALQCFLAAESILAFFVRHSPFLANDKQWPSKLVELNRHTYATTLCTSDNFDSYLKNVQQKLRWSVNYASRAGLHVEFYSLSECPTQRINSFYRLYAGLMQQKQTSEYYLFSEDFFLEHARWLGQLCELAEIVDPASGEMIAGAFFLLDPSGWVHYHLSAATKAAMKLQAMELLISSAMHRYGNSGYRFMHLGGGHLLDESDGLSRFKAKFAGRKLDFGCTKLICNQSSYHAERNRLPLKRPEFFLISDARG